MEIPWAQYAALLGAGLAMGLGAIGPGLGLGMTATGALRAMTQQPAVSGNSFRNMLVAQAVTETPAIFSLVIAFMLYFSAHGGVEVHHSLAQAFVYLGAGLCIGLGSMGSGMGSGLVGQGAIAALGRRPSSQGGVIMYMLIGQAWVQTGGIFALVVSMLMLNVGGLDVLSGAETLFESGKYLGAGLGMGFGAIGPAIGIAYVGSKACQALVLARPEHQGSIRNTFFVGSATAQSTTIYALIVALLMMFRSL